jgi:hypothetical protein
LSDGQNLFQRFNRSSTKHGIRESPIDKGEAPAKDALGLLSCRVLGGVLPKTSSVLIARLNRLTSTGMSKMHLNAVGRDKLVRYFQAHLRSVLSSEIPIKLSASRWFPANKLRA